MGGCLNRDLGRFEGWAVICGGRRGRGFVLVALLRGACSTTRILSYRPGGRCVDYWQSIRGDQSNPLGMVMVYPLRSWPVTSMRRSCPKYLTTVLFWPANPAIEQAGDHSAGSPRHIPKVKKSAASSRPGSTASTVQNLPSIPVNVATTSSERRSDLKASP